MSRFTGGQCRPCWNALTRMFDPGAAWAKVLNANPLRRCLLIQNRHASQTVAVAFGSSQPKAAVIVLDAGATTKLVGSAYEFSEVKGNLDDREVWLLGGGAATNTAVTEWADSYATESAVGVSSSSSSTSSTTTSSSSTSSSKTNSSASESTNPSASSNSSSSTTTSTSSLGKSSSSSSSTTSTSSSPATSSYSSASSSSSTESGP